MYLQSEVPPLIKIIVITVVAGLAVGVLLPFAVFGSHEAANRIAVRSGPRAEVKLEARHIRPPKSVSERRIPQATNYQALASVYRIASPWSKPGRRIRRGFSKRRTKLDAATRRTLEAQDRQAFAAADRMLANERARI